MTRIALIALTLLLAVALPASALAQSAGDNQYQDPLAGPRGNSSSGGSSGGGGGGSSGSSTPAPSTGSSSGSPGSSSGTAGSTSSSGTAGATASGSALPRTGGHPELIALAGLVLLGGGIAVRRAAATR